MGYTQDSPDHKLTHFGRLIKANIYKTLGQNCRAFILQSLYVATTSFGIKIIHRSRIISI